MSDRDTWPNQDIGPDAGTSQRVSGNWVARHDLLLYFLLAYVLSWAVWPLVLINPQSSPLVPFWAAARGRGCCAVGRWVERVACLARPAASLARASNLVCHWPAGSLCSRCRRRRSHGRDWGTSAEYRRLHRLAGHWCSSGLNDRHRWTVRGGGLARFRASQDAASSRRSLGGTGARSYLGLWHLPELISDPGQRPPLQFSFGFWPNP